MFKRVMVAVVGLPLLILILGWAPSWATMLLLAAMCAIGAWELMRAAEALALEKGVFCLRADTHRHNEPCKAMLRAAGFTYRGNIRCDAEGDPRRQAFEKLLKGDGAK